MHGGTGNMNDTGGWLLEIGNRKGGFLHHAFLVEGDAADVVPALCGFFEGELGIPVQGNPDCFIQELEQLTIDIARDLRSRASRKPLGEHPKIFVLSFPFAITEAQQALLKLLEEPTADTHIFLAVPSADILLPTVRSRLHSISAAQNTPARASLARAASFLTQPPAERLKSIQSIIAEKDKKQALEFLNALSYTLHERYKTGDTGTIPALKEIEHCRQYLFDRSPSQKLLLEHLTIFV